MWCANVVLYEKIHFTDLQSILDHLFIHVFFCKMINPINLILKMMPYRVCFTQLWPDPLIMIFTVINKKQLFSSSNAVCPSFSTMNKRTASVVLLGCLRGEQTQSCFCNYCVSCAEALFVSGTYPLWRWGHLDNGESGRLNVCWHQLQDTQLIVISVSWLHCTVSFSQLYLLGRGQTLVMQHKKCKQYWHQNG